MNRQQTRTPEQKAQQSNKNETPELLARRQAGKEGKLWRIEVLYHSGPVTGAHKVSDRYWDEVIAYRERLYKAGLMVPLDPGHWVVISPYDIDEVHLYKQSRYFGELYP